MNKKIFIGLIGVALIILSSAVYAQQGKWVKPNGNSLSEYLTITKDTSVWLICDNQLNIVFKTKIKADTAFLKVIMPEMGRPFYQYDTKGQPLKTNTKPPKIGELFAKCYLIGKKKLHIIYFDKNFVKTVNSVRANSLPNDMYLTNDNDEQTVETETYAQRVSKFVNSGKVAKGAVAKYSEREPPVQIKDYSAIGQEENRGEIKSTIYNLYVKTLSSFRDVDIMNYYDAFNPLPKDLNEFQQKRYLLSGKEKLDSIKNDTTILIKDRKFMSAIKLGEYNFEKNGFSIEQIAKNNFFTLLKKGIFEIEMEIVFENVTNQLLIPLDASKAEELTTKYFSQSKRIAYCVYTFDYTDTQFKQNSTTTCMISQNATVKSIDFYLDNQCTQKFATITLN